MIELDAPEWWAQVPVLSGPSIRIREVEAADAAALLELFADPRVNQYLYTPPSSLTQFEGFIEWAQRQREAAKCVCFVVVPNGLQQPIGLFQLRALEAEFQVAEWGFAMMPSFWSTGLFEEAARLVAEFAFAIGVKRIEARAVVENGRANRALEKIGAKGEALLRKAFKLNEPQFLWAIVFDEWSAPKPAPSTPFEAAKIRAQIARALADLPVASRTIQHPWAPPPFPFFLTRRADDPPEEK
ncbi:MAG TPA: GNAT family protein [Vicinamibacterales bacterium]|nr:GNAT family protein [Vicinamibacterales bacterium]